MEIQDPSIRKQPWPAEPEYTRWMPRAACRAPCIPSSPSPPIPGSPGFAASHMPAAEAFPRLHSPHSSPSDFRILFQRGH